MGRATVTKDFSESAEITRLDLLTMILPVQNLRETTNQTHTYEYQVTVYDDSVEKSTKRGRNLTWKQENKSSPSYLPFISPWRFYHWKMQGLARARERRKEALDIGTYKTDYERKRGGILDE